jgi:thiol-disulfide isomerase/thioredoxin
VRRKLIVAGVVVLAAVAAIVAFTWDSGQAPANPILREYAPGERPAAPPIAGELLEGGRLDLTELRGDVVVVNVWASWCGPCRAETDDLESVYQATRASGVSFLGINIRDERDKARSFLADRVTYPSIFDPAFQIGLAFREPPAPVGPPATLVIDRDGNVAAAYYRPVGPVELEQKVRQVAGDG